MYMMPMRFAPQVSPQLIARHRREQRDTADSHGDERRDHNGLVQRQGCETQSAKDRIHYWRICVLHRQLPRTRGINGVREQ
jgi:hypothetical protein